MFTVETTMNSLSISSPIGNLVIDESGDAIVAIRWSDEAAGNGSPLLAEAARQLDSYFAGKLADFDLPRAQPAPISRRASGPRCRTSPMARPGAMATSPPRPDRRLARSAGPAGR